MEQSNLNLGNLFWHAVRQWRIILIVAVVVAAIVAGYSYLSLKGTGETTTTETPTAEYYSALATYTETKASIEATMTTLQATIDELNTYIDSSLYMQLDPDATARGLIRMHVSAEYEVVDGVVTSANDPVTSVVMAYYYTMVLGNVYDVVSEEMGYQTELAYLKEVITFGYDVTTGYLSITIYGNTTEEVTAITAIVSEYLADQYDTIYQDIYEHEITILQYIEEPTVLSGVNTTQQETRTELTTAEASMVAQQAQLDALVEPTLTTTITGVSLSLTDKLSQLILWTVIGGLASAILMLAILMVFPILKGKILEEGYATTQHQLSILGKCPAFPAKSTIVDRMIFRLSNKTVMKIPAEYYDYLSTNLLLLAQDVECVHLLGSIDSNSIEVLYSQLSDELKEKITYGGSATYDKASLELAAKADCVVLVEQLMQTSEKNLSQEIDCIKNLQKDIKGVIFLA